MALETRSLGPGGQVLGGLPCVFYSVALRHVGASLQDATRYLLPVSVFPLTRTPVTLDPPPPTPYITSSELIHLQRPYLQTRSYSESPVVRSLGDASADGELPPAEKLLQKVSAVSCRPSLSWGSGLRSGGGKSVVQAACPIPVCPHPELFLGSGEGARSDMRVPAPK